jgi:hypothetical protein
MKKLLKIVVVLVVILIVALVVASFFVGSIIKTGVEAVGPQVTKVDVKLGGASLSPLSGSGSLSGLVVGNPQGYKAESAIKVGKAHLAVAPGSIFAEKMVIKSIRIEAPEITIEGGLKDNNLTRIQKNIEEFIGGGGAKQPTDPAAGKGTGKKLQVDEFILRDAKVNAVILGQTFPLSIPDIHLTGLGSGPDGITGGELAGRVFDKLWAEIGPALMKKSGELGNLGVEALKGATKGAGDAVEKAAKGIGDLFKKK